jgi:predicted metalloendopeptidase
MAMQRKGQTPDAQSDRAFFLSYAKSFRGVIRDETLRKIILTNEHAPEQFRVQTVRNLDAWYDAFDVKPGQSLYLTPAQRVRIW